MDLRTESGWLPHSGPEDDIHHTKPSSEVAHALDALLADEFILDDEVTVYGPGGVSRFDWLRGRPKNETATLRSPRALIYRSGGKGWKSW